MWPMIVARVELHWFSFIGILLISYGIAIQPTKQGQATQIRFKKAIKPCQALHAQPNGIPRAAQSKQNKKTKQRKKQISATMGTMGLGSHGC